MSGPTVVAFSIIVVVGEWNEYLWPFLMSDDASVAPIPNATSLGFGCLEWVHGDGVGEVADWWGVVAAAGVAVGAAAFAGSG
jgi:ABC-type glycerol-3-phosphate transport system permease component